MWILTNPFYSFWCGKQLLSHSLSATLLDLSALWLSVCAYQSHWRTQAVRQMGEPWLSMAVVSSLVVRALVCLWQMPVVDSLPHSSQCQPLNGKSHCEGLFINIDLSWEKQSESMRMQMLHTARLFLCWCAHFHNLLNNSPNKMIVMASTGEYKVIKIWNWFYNGFYILTPNKRKLARDCKLFR